MPKKTIYPAIPRNKNQGTDVRALTENAEILTGVRGDGRHRAITPDDLEKLNLVDLATRRIGGTVVTELVPPAGGNPTVQTPHSPQNFIVTGGHMHIVLEWDKPTYQGHAYTEIWRSSTDDFGTAVRIKTERANIAADTVGLGASYFYWIRFVNTNDKPGPLNATAGTLGQTAINVTQLLDDLSDKVTSSQLHTDLNTRIDLIDTPTTGLVDKAASLQNQIDGLVVATDIDIYYQTTAPTGTIAEGSRWFDTDDDNHPYIYNNSAWQDARDQLVLTVQTDLANEITNRTSADSAHVARLDALEATVDNPTTGVAANTTAISGLDSRVDTAEGNITAHASDISSLQATVFDANNGVGAHTTALQALDTRVTGNEGDIASQATDISALESTVDHPSTGVAANAAGISSLDTRVTSAEGTISSHSSSIISLTSDVQDAQDTVNGFAGAISALDTRVTDAEGDVAAQASEVQTLTTTVDGYSAAIQTNANSIDGLEARYTVKVDVNGHVAGYGLAVTSNNYNNQVHSTMLFSVDTFGVSSPGAATLSFVIDNGRVVMDGAFIKNATIENAAIKSLAADKISGMSSSFVLSKIGIGNIGRAYITDTLESDNYISGTSGMRINFLTGYFEAYSGYFRGDIYSQNAYVRGDVEATSIKVGTANIINTLMLQGQTVTIPSSRFTSGELPLTASWQTVQSVSYTSTGNVVHLGFSCTVELDGFQVAGATVRAKIILSSGEVVHDFGIVASTGDGKKYYYTVSLSAKSVPSSGPVTYEVQMYRDPGAAWVTSRSLLAVEIKR